jgi:hypothetical protein
MLLTEPVATAVPPPWFDLLLKICAPLGAALAFFFGTTLRGKMNDKAIADLTIATTELAKVTHSLDKGLTTLSATVQQMAGDIQNCEDSIDKNKNDISFMKGQQSVSGRRKSGGE